MRILVLSNLYPPTVIGGYEIGCQQMVIELQRRGHSIRVVTSLGATPATNTDTVRRVMRLEPLGEPELTPMDAAGSSVRSAFADSFNVEQLRQQIDDFSPDVVYAWNLTGIGGIALALTIELRALPWVWHLMDMVPAQLAFPAGAGGRQLGALLIRSLHPRWIVCSTNVLTYLDVGGARPLDAVTILPNWLSGASPPLRSNWYVPGSTLRCLFAGQLAPHKGVSIAIDALAALDAEGHKNIVLEVFGKGPERGVLENRVLQLGLGDRVRFRGFIPPEDIAHEMLQSDVLLFPTSMAEPFAFICLEAAENGCVSIVTAGCGCTEWLVDGVHLLAAARDPTSFASALRRVIDGDVDLGVIGRRAQRAVNSDSEFRIEAVASSVEAELRSARTSRAAPMSWENIGRMSRIGERLADRLMHAAQT